MGLKKKKKNIKMFFFFLNTLQFNLSAIFLYEDGHGSLDENDSSESMDYIVDQNELTVETIATHSEYLKTVASSESSLTCPMMIEKLKDEAIHLK